MSEVRDEYLLGAADQGHVLKACRLARELGLAAGLPYQRPGVCRELHYNRMPHGVAELFRHSGPGAANSRCVLPTPKRTLFGEAKAVDDRAARQGRPSTKDHQGEI